MEKDSPQPVKILYADDAPMKYLVDYLLRVLPNGSKVDTVETGIAFKNVFNINSDYNFIILDRMMPMLPLNKSKKISEAHKESGFSINTGFLLYQYVRSVNEIIPVAILSQYMEEKFSSPLEENDINVKCLSKSEDIEDIAAVIQNFMKPTSEENKIDFLIQKGWELHSQISNIQKNIDEIKIDMSELKEVA